jgi:hypothetical protein
MIICLPYSRVSPRESMPDVSLTRKKVPKKGGVEGTFIPVKWKVLVSFLCKSLKLNCLLDQ